MIEAVSKPTQREPIIHSLRLETSCDICHLSFKVHVSAAELINAKRYPFCHLILHGNPIHALAVYVDKHGVVRGSESSQSIQIDRTSSTFQELVKWWSMHAEDDG
ncbi:MAG TPA: hypothetical protein VKM55_06230 [Candidatus Lokiarchaeia archaeon]|nr:hypothetical protein [Candidatus Lokiarchaeia archaeon]